MTLSIMGLLVTLSIECCFDDCRIAECCYAEFRHAECHYAEKLLKCYAECHYAE